MITIVIASNEKREVELLRLHVGLPSTHAGPHGPGPPSPIAEITKGGDLVVLWGRRRRRWPRSRPHAAIAARPQPENFRRQSMITHT